jgi:hypothetical protein
MNMVKNIREGDDHNQKHRERQWPNLRAQGRGVHKKKQWTWSRAQKKAMIIIKSIRKNDDQD